MQKLTLILGGCRSGKSSHALLLAEKINAAHKIFIATCVPRDPEMHARVKRHQEERSAFWQTMEVPIDLPKALQDIAGKADLVLIDCITLWISNLMMESEEQEVLEGHLMQLCKALKKMPCPVFLVTNEVGCGIVPENKLARLFRDAAGFANQNIAEVCDQVIWMVAGIPVKIKG